MLLSDPLRTVLLYLRDLPNAQVMHPQSPYARSSAELSQWVLCVTLAIFVPVTSLMTYASWKFRARPGAGGTEANLRKHEVGTRVMRWQLAKPENRFLTPEAYNQVFTPHGTAMIFLVAVPALLALGNCFVPLQIGAHDTAFRRLNAMSYWIFLFGGALLYGSILTANAPNMRWFSDAPRVRSRIPQLVVRTPGLSACWLSALALAQRRSISSSRAHRSALRAWQATAAVYLDVRGQLLSIIAFPVLNSALFIPADRPATRKIPSSPRMAAARRVSCSTSSGTSDTPRFYIMILPAFGIISELISVFSRQPIFGYGFVAGSTQARRGVRTPQFPQLPRPIDDTRDGARQT